MGVPGFFRWICQRYPLIRRKFDDPSRPIINNLYIDINGIIHHSIAATKLKGPELTPDFLSELFRNIDLSVQIVKPVDLIFIASDGVAPFAKATQQRQRRYASTQNRDPNTIDRNSITPGTQFLYDIHHKLIDFISNQKKADPLWSKPKVIYSGFFTPGEGEHKIMEYIRQLRSDPEYNPNLVHCLPGGDADLFFLALQSHEAYITLLHDSDTPPRVGAAAFEAKGSSLQWGGDSCELIHVSLIREYISMDFGAKGEELEMTIDDFIALSFLVGNDFIPFFKDVDIYEVYENIISIYKEMRKDSPHLVNDGQFNKEVLKKFLLKIVEMLRKRFARQLGLKPDVPSEEVAKLYTESNSKYLAERFVERENDLDELIKEMSHSILDAFDWVLTYYREGCPSWKWYYPYHFAPPIEFIIPFIDEHKTEFPDSTPNSPLLQLLAVLPPQSKDLLPEAVRQLMDSEELKEFFPLEFKTDLNGRKFEWQATIIVPMVDIDLFEEKFNEIEIPDEVSEKLNTLQFPIEFKNNGEIEEISISKSEVPFLPVNLSTRRPPGVPTFENFDFTFEEKVVPVKALSRFNTNPSIAIKIEREAKKVQDVKDLLNTTVLVNWPYIRPAKVIGMMDKENVYNPESNSFTPNVQQLPFPGQSIHDQLLTEMALDLGEISLFLAVTLINEDGSSGCSIYIPVNVVVPLTFRPETMLNFKPPETREAEQSERVVFIRGPHQNMTGEIIDHNNQFFTVNVHHRLNFPVGQFLITDTQNWVTFSDLVKTVGGLTFRALRQCLTKIFTDPFNTNIAFTLFTMDHRVVDGCCKYVSSTNDYVFAASVVPLVVEYFRLTGNMKKIVMDSIAKKEKYPPKMTLGMLYGGTVEHQNECYERLLKFLSEKAPSAEFPLVPENNDFFSISALLQLEEKVADFDFNVSCEVIDNVKQSEITWKRKLSHRSDVKWPAVGQRVISIADSGPALFGETGTVIETVPNANAAVVLFDNELPLATRLEGRIKTNRGLRVDISDLAFLI